MHHLSRHSRTTTTLVSVVLALALAVVAGTAAFASQGATPTDPPSATRGAHAPKDVTPQGRLTSSISGTTDDGREVTGTFTPLRFKQPHGTLYARGLLNGLVHESDGSTTQFAVVRTLEVTDAGAAPAGGRMAAPAACDILHLNLAPLDLDLLGLQIHLDQVVLDIVAAPGAGNLLGNLLCAVTGLLDGGLGGVLGRVTSLLNRILAQLGLGL
jgi:hypothetical protein